MVGCNRSTADSTGAGKPARGSICSYHINWATRSVSAPVAPMQCLTPAGRPSRGATVFRRGVLLWSISRAYIRWAQGQPQIPQQRVCLEPNENGKHKPRRSRPLSGTTCKHQPQARETARPDQGNPEKGIPKSGGPTTNHSSLHRSTTTAEEGGRAVRNF